MGCVTSKKDINDLHPNIFEVSNVDDLGQPISSGQLEVNHTELVLHQKGKPPIRWPLKSLRRYGYDSQVFSFEAGRRCPTGSGIYAFSCHRAEQLFNYVQAHVQMRNSEDTVSRDLGTPTPGPGVPPRPQDTNYLEPTPLRHSLPRISMHNGPSRLSSVGSSNGCTSPSSPLANNNYTNEEIFLSEEKLRLPPISVPDEPPPIERRLTQHNLLPVSPTQSAESVPREDSLSPVYMNVMPGNDLPLDNALPDDDEPRHCYANLIPGDFDGLPKFKNKQPLSLQLSSLSCGRVSPPGLTRNVNYIVLDLDRNTVPPSPVTLQPDSPVKLSEGYVTIDFDRTVALSHSINPSFENDSECLRRTRHNSTINDLVTPTSSRQSASLSD